MTVLLGAACAVFGFVAIGGFVGYLLGGGGAGAALVGVRGLITGETPRLF